MPNVVYKYDLQITNSQYVVMPEKAKILKVAFQNDQLRVWVLVDTSVKQIERAFAIVGTGHPCLVQKYEFVDTVFQNNGLVWHIFDMGERN